MQTRIAWVSVAVLFGVLVGSNLLTAADAEGWEVLIIGGSAVVSPGGGVASLLGLERGWRGCGSVVGRLFNLSPPSDRSPQPHPVS